MALSFNIPRTNRARRLVVVLTLGLYVAVCSIWILPNNNHHAATVRPPDDSRLLDADWDIDYVSCFEDVKAAFAVPSGTDDFCSAPCIDKLLQYMEAGGVTMANVAKMESSPNHENLANKTSSRGRIIVTSVGGVATSFLVSIMETHLGYELNSITDEDFLKHASPSRLFSASPFQYDEEGRIVFDDEGLWGTAQRRSRYAGVIYVLGDPVHAIFSHFTRRWAKKQFEKLNFASHNNYNNNSSEWWGSVEALFQDSAARGDDVFGIGNHARQWMDLQDHVHFQGPRSTYARTTEMRDLFHSPYFKQVAQDFPPLFITDLATAQEAPSLFAELLNVPAENVTALLNLPGRAKTHRSKRKSPAEQATIVAEAGATEVYANLTHEIDERVKMNYLFYAIKFRCR